MPIAGWYCPECERNVPLDHFGQTTCGERIPADYIGAILKGRATRYSKGEVTVTAGLGCVRRLAIEYTEPYYVDPLSLNALESGTAWHNHMEDGSVDPANTEVQVEGQLAGLRVRGKVDRLLPATKTIADHKTQKESARKYLKAAKPEHCAQLAIYGNLVQQTQGWTPTRGIIWYHDAIGFTPMVVDPLPTLDEALALKPYGGDYTVGQLYAQAADFYAGVKRWEELPLSGESMRFGVSSACNFCSVKDACFIQAKGAPW